MTTAISKRGQILIPKDVRRRNGLRAGDKFHLSVQSNGDLLLRPLRLPEKSLVWHLRRLRGLEIDRNRESLREVEW